MEILLAQLEKKITNLLAENARIREQKEAVTAEKNSIEEDRNALKMHNEELLAQAQQIETQLQAVENRLFHLVNSVPTDEYAAVSHDTSTTFDEPNTQSEDNSEQEQQQNPDGATQALRIDTSASQDDIFTATNSDDSIDDAIQDMSMPRRYTDL